MLYRINAFGERVLCAPASLAFAKPAAPSGGGGKKGEQPSPEIVELDGEQFTFPTKTPVANMTAEERAEYWRHEAKKQQKKARESAANAEPKPKAKDKKPGKGEDADVEQRLEEARRDGENTGAEKYLRPAIEGRFQALTGLDEKETAKIFAHVDVSTFIDDDGEIDVNAITEFADTHVPAGGSRGSGDPVRDAANRSRPAGGSGDGMSMSDRRKAARKAMTKKKK